ncbi:MAG: hypothetical protein ACI4N3_05370 [Alphaproteobacteria bacterium]
MNTDWMQYIPSIITAIGTIILGWFTYNQYRKNKMTDLEIDKIKNQDKIENKRRSDNATLVFGELWSLLYELKADRVYIVQPHPLGHEEMLTVYFEVKRKGVEPMRPHIQNLKINEVAKFASELVKNLFWFITDIDAQVEDRYANSIISSCGCKSAIIKRLSDNRHDWVGSIFCEFTNNMEISEEDAREILHNAATNIQYILPEVRE